MAIVIGLNTKNAAGDLTNNALAGMIPGLLLSSVLGVVIMTSEYSSGLIRATLAAVPCWPLVLAAKAAVSCTTSAPEQPEPARAARKDGVLTPA